MTLVLSFRRLAARAALLLSAAALATPAVGAQGYFGQNQVQYDHFKWKVIETEHFLVHYYPQEREAAVDAARLAERAYARLSRILDHQFREKKPIVLFASRADFGQNNVTGDLGEGTGGVTEALRHRMLLPFTGDYKTFEHVLTHEMVHEFQYDIFARGKAGAGLQTLQQVNPPLWFAEGMAEYLSIGPDHPFTDTWLRDATLNGNLPTIEQMTLRPDRYFPYRFGESLMEYIGHRWGDEIIGEILNAVTSVGMERGFKRQLGLSLEELSDEWREAMQTEHLPGVAKLQRARKFSQPLLSERRSGGQIFLAPSLSSDGKYIAFLSNGSFLKGEVFIDLWLGDAKTGKRIKRLVKSTTDPNFEELRLLYSQSAFSPDGRYLAFTAQRLGKDVLYLLDVKRKKTTKRYKLPLEGVTSPVFSPDGRQLAFSGNNGGITDLYIVNVDGSNVRRLTNDRYGDLQPQWSPDGRTIAFASDRGPATNFDVLRFNEWMISTIDVTTGEVQTLPGQAGLNLNPQWAPDGRSLAYVTDRTGIQNVFLYDLDSKEHYQLTNVVGGVTAITEVSPAISWAHQADQLAFTYFENGDYTIWSIDKPRMLRKKPFREAEFQQQLAQTRQTADSTDRAARTAVVLDSVPRIPSPRQRSLYRSGPYLRASSDLPAVPGGGDTTTITVAALLDSAALALPDTSTFHYSDYHVGFQPEYVARPSVGYAQNNFGRGVFGGTTIILSDLLGNNRLAFSGQVNGRVSEAQLYGAYFSMSRRLQYVTGVYQVPLFYFSGQRLIDFGDGTAQQEQDLTRFIIRQSFATALYPLNRFTRFEAGAQFNNIDRATLTYGRIVNLTSGLGGGFTPIAQQNQSSLNYVAVNGAYVSDNTLFGTTGPIFGRRYRFQIEPTLGSFQWIEYLADYRRYDPILFNFLTVATRFQTSISVGRDEARFPKYIGRPDYIRGYDRASFSSPSCSNTLGGSVGSCNAVRLLGSRVALANAELRFPLIRRIELGLLPIALPPVDGLFFYDAGVAWSKGQSVSLRRPSSEDETLDTRYPLRSYGAGLRLNLFGFAIVKWDYAIPLDQRGRKGFWTWSLGPSF